MPQEMTVIPRVPIAQVGTWATSTGEWEATRRQFEDAVRASQDPTCPRPRIWVDHDPERVETGTSDVPASGWLSGLTLTEDNGGTLLADFNVPQQFADEMPVKFPGRSIEGREDVTAPSGQRYGLVLDGVAVLGRDIPAVTPLPDMAEVLGLIAPREPIAAAGTTASRLIVCALGATPAPTAGPDHQRTEAAMADDATTEDATVETTTSAEATTTEVAETAEETTTTTDAATTAPVADAADTTSSGLVIPDGFELVESGKYREMQEAVAQIPDLVKDKRERDADAYFKDKVHVAKSIAASSVPDLREKYMKDPEATRAICDLLPAGVHEPPPTGRIAAQRGDDTDPTANYLDEDGNLRDEYRVSTPQTVARRAQS